MKKIIFFLIASLTILIGFILVFGLYESRFIIGRASFTQIDFSVDNSYVFTSPLRAAANSQEKIRITVFVLNNQGLGVMGRKVSLSQDANLNMETIQGLTDNFGKAVFDVSSNKPAEYYLEVKIDDKALPQKAHLSFY